MLLEFRVGNYLSFKDTVTLSMEAASISEHEDSNVFEFDKYKLLKSAVIYGANASGKSNLIKAWIPVCTGMTSVHVVIPLKKGIYEKR